MNIGRPTEPLVSLDARAIRIALASKNWRVPDLVAALGRAGIEAARTTVYGWLKSERAPKDAARAMKRVLR